MLRRLLPVFILLSLVPVAAAGPLGELDSDAPVALFGSAFVGGDDLLLFHKAFRDGSFSGTLYSGTIIDRETRVTICPSQPGSPPQESTRTLASTDPGRPSPVYFELDAHGLALVEFGDEGRAAAGSGDATAADSADGSPAAYLGPNPYPLWSQQSSAGGYPGDMGSVRAFPASDFLVAPATTLNLPFEGVAVVGVGNLTIVQDGQPQTVHTATQQETDSDCPGIPIGAPTGYRYVYHEIRIQADTASLHIEQDHVDRLQRFYDESRPPQPTGNDYQRVCPASDGNDGYYDPRTGGSLDTFYENCSLPATSYTDDNLTAMVDGVARFDAASGTVATSGDARKVENERIDLAGNLDLEPLSVGDDQRTMRTDLGGSIFSVDSPKTPASDGKMQAYAAGAAGGALLLGVLVYAWPSLKWKAASLILPLYARLKKDEILENPLRDDILSLVQETPGISASELGRRVECGWGTLVYHLTVLERMQLVSSAREGRHKRFFAQGRINYSDKGAVGLLANPAAKHILDAIRQSPGMIQKDLSERLGLSPGTIAWHVERLAAEGLVLKEDEGRTVRYYPSERLLQLTKSIGA